MEYQMSFQSIKFQEQMVNDLFVVLKNNPAVLIGAKVSSGKSVIPFMLTRKRKDQTIIVLAPSWIQLYELEKGMRKVYGDNVNALRMGGAGDNLRHLEDYTNFNSVNSYKTNIIFTTIFTLFSVSRKRKSSHLLNLVDVVIHDETHMVAMGKLFSKLKSQCRDKGIKLVELSGTPVEGDSVMVRGPDFEELKKLGRISDFKLIPVHTGQEFKIDIERNQISDESFRKLSENKDRNDFIINFIKNTKFNKCFVVCVNIDHANYLFYRLLKIIPNAQVAVYHGNMKKKEKNEVLEKFRSGKIKMLLGVRALFTGLSVEDADVLFNTRPSESPRVFEQSLGRIIRYHEGKKMAYYYDFADNLAKHKDYVYSPTMETPSSSKGPGNGIRRLYPKEIFSYDRDAGFTNYLFNYNGKSIYLPIHNGISFGLEIEFTKNDPGEAEILLNSKNKYEDFSKKLTESLKKKTSLKFKNFPFKESEPDIDYEANHSIVYDGSCLAEVVTRVLKGTEGISELEKVLDGVSQIRDEFDIHVNYETGLHVHIGTKFQDVAEIKIFLHNIRAIEPYLALLVSPSRVCEFLDGGVYDKSKENQYTLSWLNNFSFDDIEYIKNHNSLVRLFKSKEIDPKYMSFNLSNILFEGGIETLEVRMHNGSFDQSKIVPWVSLMSQLVETLKREHSFTYREKKRRIPIPTHKNYEEFESVISEALNFQSRSLVEVLKIRARECFASWNNIK
jgi:superfamily II DNA or RNA helicase